MKKICIRLPLSHTFLFHSPNSKSLLPISWIVWGQKVLDNFFNFSFSSWNFYWKSKRKQYPSSYLGQFDASNYIIFQNVEIFKFYFFQIKKYIVKDNSEYLGIFHLLKWIFSRLINYLMDMCWNGQGTTVVTTRVLKLNKTLHCKMKSLSKQKEV